MPSKTPIAYADETGYVSLPVVSGRLSDQARERLIPLYTQEEVNASWAKFHVAQGLNPDGSDKIVETLEQAEAAVAKREADVATQNAMPHVPMSQAAREAVLPTTQKGK
jgi:hypothetical protein